MAKNKEELKEEAVNEAVEKNEEKTTTEEILEEKTSEDEGVSKEKVVTVIEMFRDKYDANIVYNPKDVFIKDEKIEGNKPVKARKGKYKVSKERYEELQRSLYTD